jgi:MFS transporter, DHA1 family, tetracycline resistance protein
VLRRSPLLPIFLIVLVDVLGLTMMMPLLPFYAQHLGATPLEVGLLISVYALFQLLAGPPLGNLSDRYGRKPVLVISQLGTFTGFLMLGFAQHIWMAFAARILDGITAGNLTVAQAYISDVTRPSQRTKSFAVIGIAFGIGFLIGPAATGLIAQRFGEHTAVFTAAGLSFLSIVATLTLLPSQPPKPEPEPGESAKPELPGATGRRMAVFDWGGYLKYLGRPDLAPLFWQFFAFALSFSLFTGGFGLFAERRFTWEGQPFRTREVGYVLTYAGLLGVFLQGGMGRIVKAFPERGLLFAGFAGQAAGLVLLGLADTIAMLAVASTVLAAGGLLRPILSSGLSKRAAPDEQGIVIGLTQSLSSVAQIAGPIAAGALIQGGLLHTWGFLAAAVASAGIVFLMWDAA